MFLHLAFEQAMSAMRAFLPREQKVISAILEKKGFKPTSKITTK
jgi:hypothetical protein